MDGDAGLLTTRAHPKVVGGNRPDLRNQQVRANLVTQSLYREYCLDCMLTREQVFRLQFFAGARGKAHPKVRQPFVPGARDSHLFRAVLRRELDDWMQILGRPLRSVEFWGSVEHPATLDSGLQPNLVHPFVSPVGE